MGYPDAAWERAMKVQDVILRALSGEIHWFRAAEIVGLSARSMRRWRQRYETGGYDGLERFSQRCRDAVTAMPDEAQTFRR